MEDIPIPADGQVPPVTPLNQEIPDVMNDPAFNPSSPKNNSSPQPASDPGSDASNTCRICRSEGSEEEPLFHPCKCSGSIKFVHQECLMEWLSHSHKKHCELCKTPFRFTKLYDAHMPSQLPWEVFVKRAFVHVGQGITSTIRGVLVSMVWMMILPWFVRWAWRWMFWLADVGWARESYLHQLRRESLANMASNMTAEEELSFAQELERYMDSQNATAVPAAYGMAKDFVASFGQGSIADSQNRTFKAAPWPQADSSIFSSWTYISEPTSNAGLNRMILDIFEGQLITCVVIIGFILVFLIREWVVQQQPLVNLDQFNDVQQRIRDAADNMNEENERFRRQQELLDSARRRLLEYRQATDELEGSDLAELGSQRPVFEGWERLEQTIDGATELLRGGDKEGFEMGASMAMDQIRAAGYVQESDLDAFTDKVFVKLTSLNGPEKAVWEEVLMTEIKNRKRSLEEASSLPLNPASRQELGAGSATASANSSEVGSSTRPAMPERGASSMTTQVQRLLEEADAVFKAHEARVSAAERPDSQPSANAVTTTESSSTTGIETPASEGSLADKIAQLKDRMSDSGPGEGNYEIPVANAGPDAKINIKRSGDRKMKAVPEPKPKKPEDVPKKAQEEDAKPDEKIEGNEGAPATDAGAQVQNATANSENSSSISNNNSFHPEGPPPVDQSNDNSLSDRVASVFREEFGLDELEATESHRQDDHTAQGDEDAHSDEESAADTPARQTEQQQHPATYAERMAEWFWGDIQVNETVEAAPIAHEERMDNDANQEAPFVPVQDEQPAPHAQHRQEEADEQRDPEVVAAAAQAGLDAEAAEDAEDLEGIFELIGFQGPIAGLFQTSMFCLVLVIGTVLGAVGLPYHWGKAVLMIIGRPFYFVFVLPLQIASFIADLVIDASLFAGGWLLLLFGLGAEVFHTVLGAMLPWFPSVAFEKMTDAAMKAVTASGGRLQTLFTIEPSHSSIGWGGAILNANIRAHASLAEMQHEVDAVLGFFGRGLFAFAEFASTGSSSSLWKQFVHALGQFPVLPERVMSGFEVCKQYIQPLIDALSTLKTGALTIPISTSLSKAVDPSLVFWSSTDRFLTVLTGYSALALLAAAYVIADTPITRSPAGQKTEKQIRDTLRQAGGVFKVILIISIEMLAFPLYCGLLLDVAFLPLFEGASMSTRLAFAARKPYTFGFIHWFLGTCYMFHFALFVSMCRKILRKGVLWFIRDPDDPTFHPVRDVLERNVATQLRKIAFSALVYGALVILCLGGVIWTIGKAFEGIFPIHWMSTEPVFEFPIDLLLYNFLTPVLIRLFKPSDAVHVLYAWWLKRCARLLRLSHFLFDDRRKDEEGDHIRSTWSNILLMRNGDPSIVQTINTDGKENTLTAPNGVSFERSGSFALTPCNDQYRPPKAGEAFLHTTSDDVYITDRDGNRNEHFAAIYIPPNFRIRVGLFMVCLWVFSAFTGLCATLVPLVFGRRALAMLAPGLRVNDIYAYSIGAYTLAGLLFAVLKSRQGFQRLRERTDRPNLRAWVDRMRFFAMRSVKCLYVYGFLLVVLPTLFALALQFYLVLPLHTYAARQNASLSEAASSDNISNSTTFNQSANPATGNASPISHNFHLLQDYALGLLYVRLASRSFTSAPSSRLAEAFRRVTQPGYLNPRVGMFTRFFVLPTILISALVFFTPPLGAWATVVLGSVADEAQKTLVYRYAYPVAAGLGMALAGVFEVAGMTSRWRTTIRDEVYLVGERLHNFGEKRPPVGTRSVVRRE